MSSPSALTRFVSALLLICGTFSVALVADSAVAAPAFKVTLNVSDSTPTVGQRVRFSGKVTPAADGKRVILQGKVGNSGWITVKRLRLSDNSTYRVAFAFPGAGNVAMRVVKPRSGGSAKGVSPVRRIRISQGGPRILTSSVPNAVVGVPYSAAIETVDGRAGNYAASGLPAGLSIGLDSGVITGTPTTAGTFDVRVWFRDTAGRVTSKPFTLTVNPPSATPTIITDGIPDGAVSSPYSVTLLTDGNRTGTWSVATGALPAGLSLAPSTGVISGTPTATASATTFTVRFTQTGGLADTQALTMSVTPASPPVITTTTLPRGVINVPYSATLKTADGRAGTWTVDNGTLHNGLSLNPSTGVISGTPTQAAPRQITVRFTVPGAGSDTQVYNTLDIKPADQPVISTATLPPGIVGSAYNATLQNVGNKSGTWSIASGSLPAGLTLSSTGVISGAPQVPNNSANPTPTFNVRFVQSGGGDDVVPLSIKINPNEPPLIAASTLPNAILAQPYHTRLRTAGNVSGTWDVISGALPHGLSLDKSTGEITGYATVRGTFSFTAKFTALNNQTDTQAFTIRVP